ncbi:MAG: SDR family NAD(P)-dependent oxidoreductase [Nitrososphaerales archaeon]
MPKEEKLRLAGKVTLVTGGGSGIGQATAQVCAREGAKIVISDVNESGGKETMEMIRKTGRECVFVQGDVSVEADAERMVRESKDRFGKLDVVFNNAGYNQYGSVHELTEDQWDRLIAVNLKGVFLVSKHALKLMMAEHSGSIVNNASSLGFIGREKDAVYCASKGAVISLTRQMALDYAAFGIRVNCICAGPTWTPRLERAVNSAANPKEAKGEIISKVLLRRFADPAEIANCVLFLASDEASFVTGSSLVVDGGQTIN